MYGGDIMYYWILIAVGLIYVLSLTFYYYSKNYLFGVTNRILHIFVLSGCLNFTVSVLSIVLCLYYSSDPFPIRALLWAFVAGGNLFLSIREKREFDNDYKPNTPA